MANDNNHGGYRPGSGRKPSQGETRKLRSFKCTDSEYDRIKANAEKAGLSVSEYIRRETTKGEGIE